MHRRTYLTTAFALSTTTLAPSAFATQDNQPADQLAEPIPLEGTGQTVTDEIDLDPGVTIAEAAHDGESNFVVELVPVEGEFPELLVNVIGSFDGAAGTLIDGGAYVLDVDADGDWTVDLLQPEAAEDEADRLPVELEGDQPAWAGPYLFEGLATASASHEGQGNFIVEVLPQDGPFTDLVVNEIGRFEGETTVQTDGIGYVTVQADGPWTLAIE